MYAKAIMYCCASCKAAYPTTFLTQPVPLAELQALGYQTNTSKHFVFVSTNVADVKQQSLDIVHVNFNIFAYYLKY